MAYVFTKYIWCERIYMSPKFARKFLADGSYLDISIFPIRPDRWRPHGVRYRLAWIKAGKCRVLFDNHHGKHDHVHVDGKERLYVFTTVQQLRLDFETEIVRLGGVL